MSKIGSLVILCAALTRCGGGGPTELVFEIDRSQCSTDCSTGGPTFEFFVVRKQSPLNCILSSSKQSKATGEVRLDPDVAVGDSLLVVASYSCMVGCVQCSASQQVTVAEDASIKLSLKPSACIPPLDVETAELCSEADGNSTVPGS